MIDVKQVGKDRIEFTQKMSKDYTILIPMMAPIHFSLLKCILIKDGYNVELLTNNGPSVVEEGLKYVHNDTCYPALLVIGQMLDAINSGKYDLEKTAVAISQTGGGCRASNYIFLLRKALQKAGYPNIPVISLNLSGLESNSGFKITLPLLKRLVVSLIYGDALMLLNNQVKPYEYKKGESGELVQQWIGKLSEQFNQNLGCGLVQVKQNLEQIAHSFAQITINHKPKIKVGIVGEIYVKYASLGNNNLEDFLAEQGCEVMVPGLLDFILYCVDNTVERAKLYGDNIIKAKVASVFKAYLTKLQTLMIETIRRQDKFIAPSKFDHTKSLTEGLINIGCVMGEGWLLTAEMMELINLGYNNIICTQPFGCLPNHICGKGMIHKIKSLEPRANIVPIDYDPSATRVNQENRIKLMLAVAKENLQNNTPKEFEIPNNSNTQTSKWSRVATSLNS